MKIAVIGGGWAGMAAATELAHTTTHHITVLEAAATWGGRARGLPVQLPDGELTTIDNGQHILIGAYTSCRQLMALVGVDEDTAFTRLPLTMRYPDGSGIAFPDWPALPAGVCKVFAVRPTPAWPIFATAYPRAC